MKPVPMLLAIVAAILFTFVEARPPAAEGPYQLINEVPIGGDGGWDYLNVDPGARRLYISHASKVVVYDMTTDAIIGEIADTPGIHGAVPGPGGRVFTSNEPPADAPANARPQMIPGSMYLLVYGLDGK